jgi:predicted RNA-binding Zn-ribbon protein involved in translation (DUF1610 family)
VSALPPEPALKCQACGETIALSSGWGPVGAKQFRCPHCGDISELRSTGQSTNA